MVVLPLITNLVCSLVRAAEDVFATLLVDPTGDDNSVLYTAREAGAGGEDISVEYAAVATSAETTVAVVGDAITVTPGSKARMVVTGTLTSDGGTTPFIFGPLLYAGTSNGRAKYSANPTDIFGIRTVAWNGSQWILGRTTPSWWSDDDVATPDLATTWNAFGGGGAATGTPTVTAGVSSAAQVIAAVNASGAASALVTASESGASTGPVAAVAAANLTLTPANALTLDGEVLTLNGEILTLD